VQFTDCGLSWTMGGIPKRPGKRQMLTLTRKPEETIVIGDGPERIEVIVKEIRRNQVRLGIVAPENVRIFRKELIEREETQISGGDLSCEHVMKE